MKTEVKKKREGGVRTLKFMTLTEKKTPNTKEK